MTRNLDAFSAHAIIQTCSFEKLPESLPSFEKTLAEAADAEQKIPARRRDLRFDISIGFSGQPLFTVSRHGASATAANGDRDPIDPSPIHLENKPDPIRFTPSRGREQTFEVL